MMRRPITAWGGNAVIRTILIVALLGCTQDYGQRTNADEPSMTLQPAPARELPTVGQTAVQPQSRLPKVNLSYADRAAWHRVIPWPQSCDEAFAATMNTKTARLEFYELADKQYLVEIQCTRGAYQGFQVYAHLDETQEPPAATVLTFPTFEAEDEHKLDKTNATEIWGLSAFDPTAKELTILNKFRGSGDCGTFATYRFHGRTPELKELRAKLTCDGKGAENPRKWRPLVLPQ